jgi:hypothetical protein
VLQRAQTLWLRLRESVSVGRRILGVAALVGVAFFIRQLLAQKEDLYPAFLKGAGAAFVVMVLLGTAQQFWRNKKVTQAQGPGGTGGLTFGDETKATQKAVDDVNTRVTKQMGDVNKRLYDLESAVFKPSEQGDDKGE